MKKTSEGPTTCTYGAQCLFIGSQYRPMTSARLCWWQLVLSPQLECDTSLHQARDGLARTSFTRSCGAAMCRMAGASRLPSSTAWAKPGPHGGAADSPLHPSTGAHGGPKHRATYGDQFVTPPPSGPDEAGGRVTRHDPKARCRRQPYATAESRVRLGDRYGPMHFDVMLSPICPAGSLAGVLKPLPRPTSWPNRRPGGCAWPHRGTRTRCGMPPRAA